MIAPTIVATGITVTTAPSAMIDTPAMSARSGTIARRGKTAPEMTDPETTGPEMTGPEMIGPEMIGRGKTDRRVTIALRVNGMAAGTSALSPANLVNLAMPGQTPVRKAG